MDFGALPPEVNSARMYAGAGSGSMLAAASAWDGLAAQLHSTATSYGSVISGLTGGWQGPSSASMAAAAAPYMAWMSVTATQAEQAANQARAAASAYQSAFAATVHPAVIASNRSQLASLMATNIFGQNTTAIAATEAQYGEMWAQDAAAMYGYAGSSAAASTVTPFNSPSQTTNPAGTAAQGTAVARAAGTAAGTHAQTLMSAAPSALKSLAAPAAPLAAAAPASPLSALTNLLSTLNSSPLATIAANAELIPKSILPANDVLISIIMGLVIPARALGDVVVAAGNSPATGALAAGLGSGTGALASAGSTGLVGAGPAVSAGMGNAGLAGGLSVPTSWATATPTIRLAATVLQGTSPGAAPAVTANSSGSLFGQMALASLAGGALGGAVPRIISGPAARAGRPTADKDSKTPDKLKRVLAELSAKPESVQHWHTNEAQLESLLARLSKKPGIHAVHLSGGDKPKPTPPKSQSS